jgi:hypothetical protein
LETRKLHRKQERFHRAYKNTPTLERKAQWLEAATLARKSKRRDMYNFERSHLDAPNPRSFHRFVKSRLKPVSDIPALKGDHGLITSDNDKCDMFNSFFASVFFCG